MPDPKPEAAPRFATLEENVELWKDGAAMSAELSAACPARFDVMTGEQYEGDCRLAARKDQG